MACMYTERQVWKACPPGLDAHGFGRCQGVGHPVHLQSFVHAVAADVANAGDGYLLSTGM